MKKILILFGGNSNEHLISCFSAKSILENIDFKKYKITAVGITKKGDWYIFDKDLSYLDSINWYKYCDEKVSNICSFLKSFNIVFPIIHGTNGEDGKLQGMLDFLNIKYVGCKTTSSAIGMDKGFMKIIFEHEQIPQLPFQITKNKKDNNINYPVIIKPANGGSSIGISIAYNDREYEKAWSKAKKYDSKIIVEPFIKAREFECSILNNYVSSIGEVNTVNTIYDYNAKYFDDKSTTSIADNIDNDIVLLIKDYALRAFNAIDGSGYARVDFLYDETNKKIYVNEINTIPGFTNISMFSKLLINDGYSFRKITNLLINSVK